MPALAQAKEYKEVDSQISEYAQRWPGSVLIRIPCTANLANTKQVPDTVLWETTHRMLAPGEPPCNLNVRECPYIDEQPAAAPGLDNFRAAIQAAIDEGHRGWHRGSSAQQEAWAKALECLSSCYCTASLGGLSHELLAQLMIDPCPDCMLPLIMQHSLKKLLETNLLKQGLVFKPSVISKDISRPMKPTAADLERQEAAAEAAANELLAAEAPPAAQTIRQGRQPGKFLKEEESTAQSKGAAV